MNSFEPSAADMAQVIKEFLPAYRQRYKLSAEQASVCQSILQCQTEALGGEPVQCSDCGYEQVLYHSCGNRHCPRCKQRASQQWEEKQLDALLPVRYYHLVFTLPHEFNGWCQLHPKAMYGLLFRAVWQTLSRFSQSHKRLNGQLGSTCVLHTWGQNLQQHVHMHCLIPGLALKSGQDSIETTNSDYLYPVNALKKVYRGKLVSLLRQAWQKGLLFRITHPNEVNDILSQVMAKSWSVYIRPCIEKPQTVVKYLSRYTYRIAISNSRIVAVKQGMVYFRWKDYANNHQQKIMALKGVEFLRRFLMHVLPNGFMRIRHYGFLANCVRKAKLAMIRTLMKVQAISIAVMNNRPSDSIKTVLCQRPVCHKGVMQPGYAMATVKKRRR